MIDDRWATAVAIDDHPWLAVMMLYVIRISPGRLLAVDRYRSSASARATIEIADCPWTACAGRLADP